MEKTTESQHESAQRLYDKRAPDYDDSWHPSFAERVIQIAALQKGEKILDLACGTGLVTFEAAAAVGETGAVTGVDVARGMLEQARQKQTVGVASVANVRIYEHDITQLHTLDSIKGQTFDVVTMISALVLLDDPKAAVRQWCDFLKPGGRIVLDVPSPQTLIVGMLLERTAKRLGIKLPYNRSWVKNVDSLPNILKAAGFFVEKVVSVEPSGTGQRHFKIADADAKFDKDIEGETMKILARGEVKEKARVIFKDEWAKAAVDGELKAEDIVWVVIARKPL